MLNKLLNKRWKIRGEQANEEELKKRTKFDSSLGRITHYLLQKCLLISVFEPVLPKPYSYV